MVRSQPDGCLILRCPSASQESKQTNDRWQRRRDPVFFVFTRLVTVRRPIIDHCCCISLLFIFSCCCSLDTTCQLCTIQDCSSSIYPALDDNSRSRNRRLSLFEVKLMGHRSSNCPVLLLGQQQNIVAPISAVVSACLRPVWARQIAWTTICPAARAVVAIWSASCQT